MRLELNIKNQSGQAATEYAVFTAAIIGIFAGTVNYFLPDMIPDLINSLQIYVNSYYFVLTMPFP